MGRAKKWCTLELDALADLIVELQPRDGHPEDWAALAERLPKIDEYPVRSGKAAQNAAGQEELQEVVQRRRWGGEWETGRQPQY
jgi:hypothetical protein